ncbi:MAG TPA: hypothetical protein VK400_14130 [Pyrinomonadaceae bacterium]|nr:hypothetical protein [Pyrinomonadaceae bacterium]
MRVSRRPDRKPTAAAELMKSVSRIFLFSARRSSRRILRQAFYLKINSGNSARKKRFFRFQS